MVESFNDFYFILGQVILIFGVLFLLFRKQIFSVFDPLLFYVLTQAFSIELGLLQIKGLGYLTSFLLYQLFFTIGFVSLAKDIRKKSIIDDTNLAFKNKELKFWYYFTIIGFIIILLSNIYLISAQGIILLSDNPTSEKVSAFEGGGGIGAVRRINWGLLNLVNLTTVFLYTKTKKKRFLFILVILVLITISGGAKASLLIYVTILAFLGQLRTFNRSRTFQNVNKVKLPLLIFGSALAIFIISTVSGSLTDSILGLGIRFLYFGDILFYYYNSDAVKHFQQLGSLDFVNYELNPLLGMLRITPYLPPLSFEMVQYSFSHNEVLDVVTGPNLPYYVKGHIFFGVIGGLIYSFLVGLFIAYIRNLIFKPYNSYTKYILIFFINLFIFSYAQDSALAFSMFVDTIFFSLPPAFIAFALISRPKYQLEKNERYIR